jgi:hypothetical protein
MANARKVIAENVIPIHSCEPDMPLAVSTPFDLPTEVFITSLERRKDNRSALIQWVRKSLVEGTDYGSIKIKGRDSKPCLFKPGAEKIAGMLGVTVHFDNAGIYDQLITEGREITAIIMRCQLHNAEGKIVAEGIGGRKVQQDGGDLNKALKMCCKSAHIDAVLRVAGLSEVFTQDLEEQTKTITTQQIGLIAQAVDQHKIDDIRLLNWIIKVCAAKGYSEVEEYSDIPAVIFESIFRKLPDFANTLSTDDT